jgi:hypothetical protein
MSAHFHMDSRPVASVCAPAPRPATIAHAARGAIRRP